jgi:RimJ/RimL family protein N-acetyltransferase
MPHSAPLPGDLPARPRLKSRAEQAVVDEYRRDEREIATLDAQLHALDHDIKTARATVRRSPGSFASLLQSHREPPLPQPHGAHVRLRDGAQIVIRTVEPEDADQLKAGFERLGAVSRYRRFLTEIDHLTREQLEYLTNVDHANHEALAALDAASRTGIAIARYVRDPLDGAQAELAVVVADQWQGRGVGAALVARLAQRARAHGIKRFTAQVMVGNEPARRLLEGVGDIIDERRSGGSAELTLRLPPLHSVSGTPRT